MKKNKIRIRAIIFEKNNVVMHRYIIIYNTKTKGVYFIKDEIFIT